MAYALLLLMGLVRSLCADPSGLTPLEQMADVTNDFGVCVLQIISSNEDNTVFSPYGLMSMALLVYEGTTGQSAAEIYNTVHLPWHRDIVRIGYRDLHRYLRSYFSTEGFLKGLVLSKANVPLKSSYIEILKFYGFQQDTSITQPLLTTLAPTESQEKMGNETFTTNIPEITTQTPSSTAQSVTTTKKMNPTRPKPTGKPTTKRPTTQAPPTTTVMATTDAVVTETNPPPAPPDAMNMQGNTNTKPDTTTTPNTTTPVTTTTPAEMTNNPLPKTTREIDVTTVVEETITATTDMNVVTMVGQEVAGLQSMNMVLQSSNDAEDEQPEADNVDESKTELPGESALEFVSISSNEITTRDVFTDDELTSTMAFTTMFVDSTLGEDLVFLTTPSDDQVLPTKGMSMLEAIILSDENKGQLQDLSDVYPFNKRSTQSSIEVLTTSLDQESASPLTTIISFLIKSNQTNNQTTPQTHADEDSIATYVNGHLFDNSVSADSLFTESMDSTSSDVYHLDSTTETMTKDTEDLFPGSGFPTLEPDTIIFPTARLPRAIKDDKRSAPIGSGSGNWVGVGSSWRQSPTSQWFWTASGDKMVPVLTYTAYLPYADIPELSASAVQLPLDDVRYSLMILLPNNARGLQQMLHSLQWHPLRNILKNFKPTPVYAVVPSFTIVKHINLTPALHKLGIRNIFDAYSANLCELSSEPNLYVRSVEQVITISVHKYFTFNKWFEASQDQVEQHFLATHPFAYFVIDVETKVALIAGTLVDPLHKNS